MTAVGYPKGRTRTNYPERACQFCGRVMPACNVVKHERTHVDQNGTVPPEDQETIVRLYNRPRASVRSVAQETHWSQSTVLRVLRAHGVEMRPMGSAHPKITSDEQLRRAQLYGRGLSIEEVAEVCGVTYEAVRQTLVRLGVPRRSRANLRWTRQRRSAAQGEQ